MKRKILIVLFVIILIFSFLFREYRVKTTYCKTVFCQFYDDGEVKPWWWTTVSEKSLYNSVYPPDFDYSKIDLSDIDFSSYNVVMSQGRKINKLVYLKSSEFPFLPYNNGGVAYLSNEYFEDQVFIYLIDKKENIKFDLKNNYKCNYKIQ